MDSWVRHQIGLELCHIHVKGTIEAQGRRQRGDDLRRQGEDRRPKYTSVVQNLSCSYEDSHLLDHTIREWVRVDT